MIIACALPILLLSTSAVVETDGKTDGCQNENDDCMMRTCAGFGTYTGTRSHTIHNVPCVPWNMVDGMNGRLKGMTMLEHNLCMSTSGEAKPWCYTSLTAGDNARGDQWDFCIESRCPHYIGCENKEDVCVDRMCVGEDEYTGHAKKSVTGALCKMHVCIMENGYTGFYAFCVFGWSEVPEKYYSDGTEYLRQHEDRYCRSSPGTQMPFCFIDDGPGPGTAGSKRGDAWDYCLIPCKYYYAKAENDRKDRFFNSKPKEWHLHKQYQLETVESDPCSGPPEQGRCKAAFQRYYFNTTSGLCQSFLWGGCGGNTNRFMTKNQCQSRCKLTKSICLNDKDVGPCDGVFKRYYFNRMSGECERFEYGGCQGNANNFETRHQCEGRCVQADLEIIGEEIQVIIN